MSDSKRKGEATEKDGPRKKPVFRGGAAVSTSDEGGEKDVVIKTTSKTVTSLVNDVVSLYKLDLLTDDKNDDGSDSDDEPDLKFVRFNMDEKNRVSKQQFLSDGMVILQKLFTRDETIPVDVIKIILGYGTSNVLREQLGGPLFGRIFQIQLERFDSERISTQDAYEKFLSLTEDNLWLHTAYVKDDNIEWVWDVHKFVRGISRALTEATEIIIGCMKPVDQQSTKDEKQAYEKALKAKIALDALWAFVNPGTATLHTVHYSISRPTVVGDFEQFVKNILFGEMYVWRLLKTLAETTTELQLNYMFPPPKSTAVATTSA